MGQGGVVILDQGEKDHSELPIWSETINSERISGLRICTYMYIYNIYIRPSINRNLRTSNFIIAALTTSTHPQSSANSFYRKIYFVGVIPKWLNEILNKLWTTIIVDHREQCGNASTNLSLPLSLSLSLSISFFPYFFPSSPFTLACMNFTIKFIPSSPPAPNPIPLGSSLFQTPTHPCFYSTLNFSPILPIHLSVQLRLLELLRENIISIGKIFVKGSRRGCSIT